jgi:hypothetical protein
MGNPFSRLVQAPSEGNGNIRNHQITSFLQNHADLHLQMLLLDSPYFKPSSRFARYDGRRGCSSSSLKQRSDMKNPKQHIIERGI